MSIHLRILMLALLTAVIAICLIAGSVDVHR